MTFDEYIQSHTSATMQELVARGTPELQGLLTQACNLFERFSHADQLLAMACMVGMVCGTLEGEHVPAEQHLGVMITHRHRLQQFVVQAQVVFWDAMEARGQVQDRTPLLFGKQKKPKKLPKRPGARVLNIITGKRKKKAPGKRGSDWGGHGI